MAQWPNATNFCLGPPDISKLWTLVAQIYADLGIETWHTVYAMLSQFYNLLETEILSTETSEFPQKYFQEI